MYVERAIGTLLVAALLASREARAARSESQDKAPVTVGALLESLRGRVWHDEAPLAEVSFRMTCIMEYLGSGGEVTRTVVLEHRRWFSRGRMQEELVSARENGQDVTERERRKEAGADDHRRGSASRWSLDETLAPPLPFLAPGGARYRLGLEAGKGTRLVYHPAEATELRVASGWVELDAADGLPLRHQFVPAPLPSTPRGHSQPALCAIGRIGVPVRVASIAPPMP